MDTVRHLLNLGDASQILYADPEDEGSDDTFLIACDFYDLSIGIRLVELLLDHVTITSDSFPWMDMIPRSRHNEEALWILLLRRQVITMDQFMEIVADCDELLWVSAVKSETASLQA